MNDSEYDELISRASDYLRERIDVSRSEFRLESFDRYDIEQETGTITFSQGPHGVVVADIQAVGTFSVKSHSWRWAWSNPSIIASLAEASTEVRSFGETHQLSELVEPTWPADEEGAWAMTALTAYLSGAEGAYRSPDSPSYFFIIYFNMRWADS